MVENKEQFEQEVYKLLSTRGKINAKEIDGIGVNYDVHERKSRVSVTMTDGETLVGEKINMDTNIETFTMFSDVADTFFSDNGVLIDPQGE